ncbi:MAG: Wzz domain-containing protein [Lachnoclostridium sp.]|jgi:capsular polysaccharide biosynthesis protein
MNYRDNELEIDMKELFRLYLRKIWIIILAGIICALLAGLISRFVLTAEYKSSTKLYIINKQSHESITYSDLQTGNQLTKDYQILVKSRPVTEQVIRDLNLSLTHEQLLKRISVNIPADTRIIEITVIYPDPAIAKQLADALGEVSAKQLVSIMEMEKVNIVEPGNLPTEPDSPDLLNNVLLGGGMGAIFTMFILLILYITDDTMKSSEDIEKYLGLTTLASIPLEKNIMESRKVKKALKKAYKKGYKGGMSNAVY